MRKYTLQGLALGVEGLGLVGNREDIPSSLHWDHIPVFPMQHQ